MEEINQLDNFFNLSFNTAAKQEMKQIALWAKIVSLSAFVSYAVSLIVVFFGHKDYTMEAEGFTVFSYLRSDKPVLSTLITVLIGALVNYFLYRFAVAAQRGIDNMDSVKLNEGLGSLRMFFKIYGILLILVIVFFIVMIIYGISVALSAR